MKVVFLDTETSGLKNSDVILSAAYIVADSASMEVLESGKLYFYDEEERCCNEALEVHHLTPEFLVKYASDYETNIKKLFELVHNGVIIGHNIAFDIRMINQTLAQWGMKAKPYLTICTMYETKNMNNGKFFKLVKLLEKVGIPDKLVEKHRTNIFGESELGLGFHSADFDTAAVHLLASLRSDILPELRQLR